MVTKKDMLDKRASHYEYHEDILRSSGALDVEVFSEALQNKVAHALKNLDFGLNSFSLKEGTFSGDVQANLAAWEMQGRYLISRFPIKREVEKRGDFITPAFLVAIAKNKAIFEALRKYPDSRPVIVSSLDNDNDRVAVGLLKRAFPLATLQETYLGDNTEKNVFVVKEMSKEKYPSFYYVSDFLNKTIGLMAGEPLYKLSRAGVESEDILCGMDGSPMEYPNAFEIYSRIRSAVFESE